jgi:hypothetical protein
VALLPVIKDNSEIVFLEKPYFAKKNKKQHTLENDIQRNQY